MLSIFDKRPWVVQITSSDSNGQIRNTVFGGLVSAAEAKRLAASRDHSSPYGRDYFISYRWLARVATSEEIELYT